MHFFTILVTVSLIALSGVTSVHAYHDEAISRGSTEPKIVTSGTDAYVIWEESTDPQFFDVYFRKITNNGKSIEEPINLTQGTSFYPDSQILASKNNVYVLWEDRTSPEGNDSVVYFKKSSDGGKTFGDAIVLSSTNKATDSIYRPITMLESNGMLYVLTSHWHPHTNQNNLSFLVSMDNGDTFSEPTILFESNQWDRLVSFAISDGVIYVVVDDEKNYDEQGDLNFRKIYPDGNLGKILKVNPTGSVTTPEIAVSGNNVYVVWREFEEKHWHLSFAKSNDNGETFDKPITLNTDSGSIDTVWSTGNHIFASGDSVYVLWPEEYWDGENQSFKVWSAKSDDSGKTFDVDVHQLDEKRYRSSYMLMTQENGNLYFVVPTIKNQPYNDAALYFAKSTDNGNSITREIDLIKNKIHTLGLPKIAIEQDNIHIVSDGDSNKNCILYFASNDDGASFTNPVNLSPNGNSKDCLGIEELILPPLQQLKRGTDPQDVKCKQDYSKGYLLALRQRDGQPVCVSANSYLLLLERGWILENSYEMLSLKAAEKFILSSPTFSSNGIPDTLNLDVVSVRKSIPPVLTINGTFETYPIDTDQYLENTESDDMVNVSLQVAQINKIHSAIINDTWNEIAQKNIKNDIPLEHPWRFHFGPTTSTLLTVGELFDKSRLVPITITEKSENVDRQAIFWGFQLLGYNGDNRGKTWDFPPRDHDIGWKFFGENNVDVWDDSKIPRDHFGINAILMTYPVFCNGVEKIEGESGPPSPIPIKSGVNTVYVQFGDKAILPDSDGVYTVRFVSLFETQVEFPATAKVIEAKTELCVMENVREEATHAYYTKLAFKMDNVSQK